MKMRVLVLSCCVLLVFMGCGGDPSVEGECGDGIVDTREACDDGNTAGGDGCSATCQIENPAVCGDGDELREVLRHRRLIVAYEEPTIPGSRRQYFGTVVLGKLGFRLRDLTRPCPLVLG